MTEHNAAEADRAIRAYIDLAHHIAADNGSAASATLIDFIGDDATASERIWGITFIGPTLIAAAAKRLADTEAGDLWVLQTDGDIDDVPADERVAARSVVRALNDDSETARDLLASHYRATAEHEGHPAAHDALIRVLHAHAHMLAELINAGAFTRETS